MDPAAREAALALLTDPNLLARIADDFDACGTQCRIHVERLIALEYVLVHQGTRGQSFEYELLYDGSGGNGSPFVAGLIEVDALKSTATMASSRGPDSQFAGPSRPHRRVDAAPERAAALRRQPGQPHATATSPATPAAATRPPFAVSQANHHLARIPKEMASPCNHVCSSSFRWPLLITDHGATTCASSQKIG